MAAGNLPSVITTVESATRSTYNTWQVTADPGNAGSESLVKGKAFVAFLSGKRYFQIRFNNSTEYNVYYTNDPELPAYEWAMDPHTGVIGQDEVFADAKAYILGYWWHTSGLGAAMGDTFSFSADPATDIVEVPVLFQAGYDRYGQYAGAIAFTSDSVNALVDGNWIFTPETYGPVVNFSGSGASDILHDYVAAAFGLCGYLDVNFVDARYYHDWEGSVHCGTNAIRAIVGQWWD